MEITVTAEPVPPDSSLLEAAEAVISQHAPSPFALRDDHEFKVAEPTGPVEAQIERNADRKSITSHAEAIGAIGAKNIARALAVAPSYPSPGSPDSPYRKCSCLAVMPGRICSRCLGSKWVKPCPKCEGDGRIGTSSRRKGSERSQPCGFCMATGQVSAGKAEIAKAEEMAKSAATAPPVAVIEVPAAFRRAARLPGIGSPEKKKKGRPGRRPKNPKT